MNGSGRMSVTGFYAGAVTRAAGAVLDILIIFGSYTIGLAALDLLTRAFLGRTVTEESTGATVALFVWAFLYSFGFLAVSARTPGKAIAGLRVVRADGHTLGPGRALLRTLCFPLSVIPFGLGFVPILFDTKHRALHDFLAKTAVVYDWGERPAELPGPLSDFLRRANAPADEPAASPPPPQP
jgi:uncharacterized RDD family membrane protein YckC